MAETPARSKRIQSLTRKNPVPTLPSEPTTGPERGQVLRAWMSHHGLSAGGLAEHSGVSIATIGAWVNGGKTSSGLDMVSDARPTNVQRFLRSVRVLEPQWGDADLWRTFGVGEEHRDLWRLAPRLAPPQMLHARGLQGRLAAPGDWGVWVQPGDYEGLQVYRGANSTWILPSSQGAPLKGLKSSGRMLRIEPLD